jgi:CDGSH-type Zn-finger protein
MSDPRIAGTKPVLVPLEPGTYWWCACGRSANQPYCDGSHQGTGFEPVQLEIAEATKRALCMCKHTKNSPDCDGTHAKLEG